MARSVGIDIGSKSLKILELEGSGNKLKMNFFQNLEIPFGSDNTSSPDLLVEPIKSIFQQYHLEQDNIVLSIPTQDCILREITVDFKEEEHIRHTIKFEAEKHLQAYDIEDVIVDYRKLQAINEKSRLFVAAVPKKIIEQRLNLLKKCNLDPISVDLDIMALVNVARYVPQAAEKDTVAIIDFGAGSTKIVIIHQGQLRHVRAIRLGSSLDEMSPKQPQPTSEIPSNTGDIDWDIENELIVSLPIPDGIEMDRMVLVKKEEGDISNTIYQRKRKEEIFQRLIKELRRTMLTMHLEQSIDLVCLTGGGSQLEGIMERIEQAFRVETILLDFSPSIPSKSGYTEEEIVSASIPLGMAMELLDGSSQIMNFRKEEYSYTNRFELIKVPLALLTTLFFLFLLFFSYHIQNQRFQYEKQYEELLEKADIVAKRRFFPEGLEGEKLGRIYSLYEKFQEAIEGGGDSKTPPMEDGFTRWLVLFQNFGKVRNRHYITMDKFSMDQKEAFWEGEIEDDQNLDVLTGVVRAIDAKIVDPSPDKTRVQNTSPNPKPSEKELKRRYRFQVGFRSQQED